MNFIKKITQHHDDEKKAVEDVDDAQKVRVSLERRIYNAEKLINEEVPETHRKHVALSKLHDFRVACEEMLNEQTQEVEEQ